MKMKLLLSSVAVAAMLAAPATSPLSLPLGATPAQAQDVDVSIGVFFDELSAHGSWVSHANHPYVWVPRDVDVDWRPYTRGQWDYTDRYGWYFASDEPFGWAVYHYGRWGFDRNIGWFWVPGTVWAPAWVSWRRGDDHVGWAPLQPEGDGFAVSIEISTVEVPRGYWTFVPTNAFLEPDLTTVIIRDDSIPVIYERTEVLGPVIVQNNIVINNVIDVTYIEEETDEDVEVREVTVVSDPTAARESGEDVIPVFEGTLAEPTEDVVPEQVVEAEQVESPTAEQEIEGAAETDASAEGEAATEDGEAMPEDGEAMPEDGEAATDEGMTEEGQATQDGEAAPDEGQAAEDGEAAADDSATDDGDAAPEDGQAVPEDGQATAEDGEVMPEDGGATVEGGAEGEATIGDDATPQDEATTDEQQAPVDAAPSDGVPAEEVPVEEAPATETPPAEAAPADQAPAEQAPAEEAPPAEDPPAAQEAPAAEPPVEEAPAGAPPAEEAPVEQAPPAEECSAEDQAAGNC